MLKHLKPKSDALADESLKILLLVQRNKRENARLDGEALPQEESNRKIQFLAQKDRYQ